MTMLLIFDDRVNISRLREKIKLLRPSRISIFTLTSNGSLSCEIENLCKSQDNIEITVADSAELIDKEVDALRQGISKWSAQLGEFKIGGKSIREWFLLPRDQVSAWWFSTLSEKDPAKTNVFFYIAQLQALDKLISSGAFDLGIYSVSNPSFSRGLEMVFRKYRINSVYMPPTFKHISFKERFRLYCKHKKAPYSLLKALINLFVFISRVLMARLFMGPLNKRIIKFENAILFVSFFPCVDKEAAERGILKNKYAVFLQDKIHNMQKRIIWIWLYNFLDGCTYSEALRLAQKFNKNGELNLFLYEFLSKKGLFSAISSWFKQIRIFLRLKSAIPEAALSKSLSIPESAVFIKELMLDSFVGWPALEGLLFLELYKELFLNFPYVSHCLYYAEMQTWEKALCAAKRLNAPRTKTIAYIHSSTPINFFSYFHHKSEMQHMPLPDILACNGDISFKLMSDCGYPNVEKVEAIRYLYLNRYLEQAGSFKKDNIVLLAGGGIYFEDKRLISLFYEAFPKPERFKVWLRPHSCLPFRRIIEELRINPEENRYIIKNGNLQDLLGPVKVLITGGSTIALEALFAGCRIIIPSFCDTMFTNPLRGFEKYYTRVSNSKSLRYFVRKFIEGNTDGDLNEVGDFIGHYWCLDPSLKRWERLLA